MRGRDLAICTGGACVPATLSGGGDFRGLCVSGFGSPVSRWALSGRRPDLELPVVGRPSSHSRFPMGTPAFQLLTLSTLDFPLDCDLLTMDPQLLTFCRVSLSVSPLEYALTQEWVCKPFGIRTYKSLDLKSPEMNTYKKYRGVGGAPVLQTLDLAPIFHCQRWTKASSVVEVALSSSASTYSLPRLLRDPVMPRNRPAKEFDSRGLLRNNRHAVGQASCLSS